MRKLLSVLAALSFVSVANAQTTFTDRLKDGSDTVRLLMGASQGSSNFGLDYERRAGPIGLGAFLLKTSKRTVDPTATGLAVLSRPETYVLGLNAPLHLVDRSNFDIYLAPGLSVASVTDVDFGTEKKNVVTFGPTLKIGAMYYVSNSVSVGLDYMTVTNWFSDRVAGQQDYANLAVGYTF
jgi:opacity protein-like surface antigen